MFNSKSNLAAKEIQYNNNKNNSNNLDTRYKINRKAINFSVKFPAEELAQ